MLLFSNLLLCLFVSSSSLESGKYYKHPPIYKLRQLCPGDLEILSDIPRLVSCKNFLSDDEMDYILDRATSRGFTRSKAGGVEEKESGQISDVGELSDRRTSSQVFLNSVDDDVDDVLKGIEKRAGKLVGVKYRNFEHFQVLKYEENQYYRTHNDWLEHLSHRRCGERHLTFFMYLSSHPEEEGGATYFPSLHIRVRPERGKAVFWYSCKPNKMEIDYRTDHAALPVFGTKYAVNLWGHVRNFRDPYYDGTVYDTYVKKRRKRKKNEEL